MGQDAYLFGPEHLTLRATIDPFLERTKMKEAFSGATFQYSLDEMQRTIAEIEAQGKTAVIKEHTFHMMDAGTLYTNAGIDTIKRENTLKLPLTDKLLDLPESERETLPGSPSFPIPNPTILPDRLLATFMPVLIIRHPCHMVSSFRRVLTRVYGGSFPDEDSPIDTQYKWHRMIYNFYKAWFSTPEGIAAAGGPAVAEHLPIVIDGDKLVNDAQGQMETWCRILHIDASGVQYTWEAQPLPENHPKASFIGTISKSTGVLKSKDGNDKVPVIEEEVQKWMEETDEKTAEGMKFWVEKTMEDYNYLLERSI
ncbi:hypothetical protein E1B28_002292 [Marasmius oreades]|uniref:Uncharacterized protein n=1 Tax=Marasmius oreades TaxID=181124 RepID=A0A9P7UNT5_9AGAR|nr:uncharacterized protein E1B28_002292 [Marasmius oreades]KAG7086329.1 hypothetical protein E1B28_002292 [Marasmius oreades]